MPLHCSVARPCCHFQEIIHIIAVSTVGSCWVYIFTTANMHEAD